MEMIGCHHIYQHMGPMLTSRKPQYATSLIISPSLSSSLLLLWLPMAGSGQEQDADILLFISEIISSEITLEDGICLHLEHSSTCGTGPGVDGGFSLSTGKAI